MPSEHWYAVILAGGRGTRLWPLSRSLQPKQFLALAGRDESLLQAAVARAVELVGGLDRVRIVVPAWQAELVTEQLPGISLANLILEPTGRNTAAAIGLAALNLHQHDPQAVMAVFPADHLFKDQKPWLAVLRAALFQAGRGKNLVTVGLQPEYPSSEYGYLELGDQLPDVAQHTAFNVVRFVEKPDPATAGAYLQSGDYWWNTGTFAWRADRILQEIDQHLPALSAGLGAIAAEPGNWQTLQRVYAALEPISIDYGVMEKAAQVVVIGTRFERIDLGSLANLSELLPADEYNNASYGETRIFDGSNNLVYTDNDEGLTVLMGVDDLVVIRQQDVILVCPKNQLRHLKSAFAALQRRDMEHYL